MNPSHPKPLELPPAPRLPLVPEKRGVDFNGMFDVATTIEHLCMDGMKDAAPQGALSPASIASEKLEAKKATPPKTSIALPTFDLLSDSFLQSIANHIAGVSGRSIGLAIMSQSGSLIQHAQSGWDASVFRTQGSVLAKVARESVWRKGIRFSSIESALEAVSPGSVAALEGAGEQIETSACLSELASIIGCPVFSLSFALQDSSGFVVFIGSATSANDEGSAPVFSTSSPMWLSQEAMDMLVRMIDTWLIVRRCSWYSRLVAWKEAIRSRPRLWMIPIGIAGIALLAPIPYYPRRECVFEPETKQYLSSPIQGRIASCEVRPGDRVEKGQLMARLDDDQLRRDLATAQAEYDGANKRNDSALATRASGNYALAQIEMNQAKWKIESIEDQLRRLEIRATTAGIVVQGDWHRSIGMPLTLGQSLFEVAELESMTAEVRLLASDLAQINVGDEVSIRSDASGVATFRGKISRIEPRATVIDDAAVFVADVIIHDRELQLRPGMKATAQINAGWKSLGWYLFNRPYRWIANQWIW